ncbi:MAG TPA: hypothetical protein VJ840_13485, partial [Gemmatimonadaceae bacterium]|nr:hypothetical protein [Gemmatimonadaceae bacterium]
IQRLKNPIKMQAIIGLISLALAAYGFTQAGVLGILTGAIAGFGVGSGLLILIPQKFTADSIAPRKRTAELLGGLISAVACVAGVLYGGWSFGSVLGMAGYAAGMLTTFFLEIVSRRAGNRPSAVNVHEETRRDRAA